MKRATLTFVVRLGQPDEVLLGRKKRGFGCGKYNGFGGKVEPDEDIRDAAAREVAEECGLVVSPQDLVPAGRIVFVFPADPRLDHDVALFLARTWRGEPRETEEMAPRWFAVGELPFAEMWQDDAVWLPLTLASRTLNAEFTFADDNETVAASSIRSDLQLKDSGT